MADLEQTSQKEKKIGPASCQSETFAKPIDPDGSVTKLTTGGRGRTLKLEINRGPLRIKFVLANLGRWMSFSRKIDRPVLYVSASLFLLEHVVLNCRRMNHKGAKRSTWDKKK